MIDWSDPAARAALRERIGPSEYDDAVRTAQLLASTVVVVNGHEIRPERTALGRMLAVGNTGNAYSHIDDARRYATSIAAGSDVVPTVTA